MKKKKKIYIQKHTLLSSISDEEAQPTKNGAIETEGGLKKEKKRGWRGVRRGLAKLYSAV